jgi:hypothetical protein
VEEAPFKKELTNKIIEDFGILLSSRISRYHSKYYEDDEVKFFNNFVICPEEDPNGNELLADLVERKIHFDDCLEIGEEVLFLKNLALTKYRSAIIYSFYWMIFPVSNDDEPVFLEFELVKDKIRFPYPSAVKFLESRDSTFLIYLLKQIRNEISFGTLSLD